MSLQNLDGIFGPQTDWSISESRTSYEVDIKIKQWLITFISNTKYVLASKVNLPLQKQGEQMASMADEDRCENGQYHWQTDVFNNMEIDEVHKNDLFNYFSLQ